MTESASGLNPESLKDQAGLYIQCCNSLDRIHAALKAEFKELGIEVDVEEVKAEYRLRLSPADYAIWEARVLPLLQRFANGTEEEQT